MEGCGILPHPDFVSQGCTSLTRPYFIVLMRLPCLHPTVYTTCVVIVFMLHTL